MTLTTTSTWPDIMAVKMIDFSTVEETKLALIISISIIVVASQWLLGGCVITRAEQRLTGEKDTILDPFLKLAGLNVNRDTRIASTIAVGTAISVILLWSVACDIFIN
jgi:hypothetical protein